MTFVGVGMYMCDMVLSTKRSQLPFKYFFPSFRPSYLMSFGFLHNICGLKAKRKCQ